MNRPSAFPAGLMLAFALLMPAGHAHAADDAGALMSELSRQVRQHSDKFVRCVDYTAARHALNPATAPETAAAASIEDCEGVLRVFIASCAQSIRKLCENFAKEMRMREATRATELIARLRRGQK